MKSDGRILIVDDEPRLVRLVKTILETEGFDVLTTYDGESALKAVTEKNPDLILLDILLPGKMSGFDVCKRIREFSNIPILMLTAKAQEKDKLAGFETGADDYLTKPFSAGELIARIKALLRRSNDSGTSRCNSLTVGDLTVDFWRRRVSLKGKPVDLTPTEYNLLRELASQPGKIFLHEELLSRVWGPEYRSEVEYLRVYVSHLRQKIEPSPENPTYIITVPGSGYMFATNAE